MAIIERNENGRIFYKSMWGFVKPSISYQLTKNCNEDGSISGKVYHDRI